MSEEGGERTEAPTAKRKRDAVEKGDILKSREFATALMMLAGMAWLGVMGPSLVGACKEIMAASFSFDHRDIEDFEPFRPLAQSGWKVAPALISLFAISFVAAILSQAGLGHIGFNGSLLAPKASRINPASGLKRIFGPQGWIELGKALLKVALLGSIGWYLLGQVAHMSMGLSSSSFSTAVAALTGTFLTVLFTMAFGMVAIAGIDVPLQLFQRLSKLRMSKQAIRDENKETEGSPEAKGALRQRQREMSMRSMRKSVGEAHVILTNPTHFAVALRYDRMNDQVPVVVAKGRGVVALAIRELGAETQIPVLEYPALARAVYYTSREGQEVRDDLYVALATVLAFVFGLNAEAGGLPPPIFVPETARYDENGVQAA
jgi:flagellar biosynthetic protein FlhB